MACRIELHPQTLRKAVSKQIASIKRQLTKEDNPNIKTFLEKDLADLARSELTITEIK